MAKKTKKQKKDSKFVNDFLKSARKTKNKEKEKEMEEDSKMIKEFYKAVDLVFEYLFNKENICEESIQEVSKAENSQEKIKILRELFEHEIMREMRGIALEAFDDLLYDIQKKNIITEEEAKTLIEEIEHGMTFTHAEVKWLLERNLK